MALPPLWLPTLSHFRNKNGWLASLGLMHFEIEPPVFPPKGEEGDTTITVALWYGPFRRAYAEVMETATFILNEEGLTQVFDFLTARAQAMNDQPQRTAEETMAWYQTKLEEASEKN